MNETTFDTLTSSLRHYESEAKHRHEQIAELEGEIAKLRLEAVAAEARASDIAESLSWLGTAHQLKEPV